MLEHYIEYEKATGVILYRATVSAGMMADQRPAEGHALRAVPYAAIVAGSNAVRLDVMKPVLTAQVDAEAGAARRPFLTTVEGQDLTYFYKADEARAYRADSAAPIPFIAAEAKARGVPVDTVVAEVLAAVARWTPIGAEIEARRRKANVAIGAADTIAQALVAATIDWTDILAQPS